MYLIMPILEQGICSEWPHRVGEKQNLVAFGSVRFSDAGESCAAEHYLHIYALINSGVSFLQRSTHYLEIQK